MQEEQTRDIPIALNLERVGQMLCNRLGVLFVLRRRHFAYRRQTHIGERRRRAAKRARHFRVGHHNVLHENKKISHFAVRIRHRRTDSGLPSSCATNLLVDSTKSSGISIFVWMAKTGIFSLSLFPCRETLSAKKSFCELLFLRAVLRARILQREGFLSKCFEEEDRAALGFIRWTVDVVNRPLPGDFSMRRIICSRDWGNERVF